MPLMMLCSLLSAARMEFAVSVDCQGDGNEYGYDDKACNDESWWRHYLQYVFTGSVGYWRSSGASIAEHGEDARRLLRAVHEVLTQDQCRMSHTSRECACRALGPSSNFCDSHSSVLALLSYVDGKQVSVNEHMSGSKSKIRTAVAVEWDYL
jgi:hypothetical protein